METAESQHNSDAHAAEAPFCLSALAYELPEGLIAQEPLAQRDTSRLLIVDRSAQSLEDASIRDLTRIVKPGDLLVLNDTKVVPAKFTAHRKTGGRVGGLFEREIEPGAWQVLLEGSRRLRVGEELTIEADPSRTVSMRLEERLDSGRWRVSIEPKEPAEQILERIGRTPLPPYIHRTKDQVSTRDAEDRKRYQTVYARRPGAIAAPTAGLHLSESLLQSLADAGVETTFVTLHIGTGTFAPIRNERLEDHAMHDEWFEFTRDAAQAVNACKARGGRVIAVGTTAVRVLESAARRAEDTGSLSADAGFTNLFIYPPYRFGAVDALLTNFHLPGSTLLGLVMALAGVDPIREAYQHAIERRYRFYSYGDAMLIV